MSVEKKIKTNIQNLTLNLSFAALSKWHDLHKRQAALEAKGGAANPADQILIQRRAATASKEAAQKRALTQYYTQVEG